MEPVLEIKGVSKSFPGVKALQRRQLLALAKARWLD